MRITTKFNVGDKVYGYRAKPHSAGQREVMGPLTIEAIRISMFVGSHTIEYFDDLGGKCAEHGLFGTRAEAQARVDDLDREEAANADA